MLQIQKGRTPHHCVLLMDPHLETRPSPGQEAWEDSNEAEGDSHEKRGDRRVPNPNKARKGNSNTTGRDTQLIRQQLIGCFTYKKILGPMFLIHAQR